MFLCCPFGEYEIDLDVKSFSDEGSTLQQRTAWEIENGPDEVLTHREQIYQMPGPMAVVMLIDKKKGLGQMLAPYMCTWFPYTLCDNGPLHKGYCWASIAMARLEKSL